MNMDVTPNLVAKQVANLAARGRFSALPWLKRILLQSIRIVNYTPVTCTDLEVLDEVLHLGTRLNFPAIACSRNFQHNHLAVVEHVALSLACDSGSRMSQMHLLSGGP